MATITTTQLQTLASNISVALANVQSRIEARVLAETLPITGNRLAAAAAGGEDALTATRDLGAALQARLESLAASGNQTDAAVVSALESHLAAQGYAGVVVGITVVAGTISISLGAAHTDSYTQTLSGDLGFGGLNLESDGSARVAASFAYDLEFGLTTGPAGGFWFETGGADEVTLALDIDQLSLGGSVSLDGTTFAATDAGSVFSGDIAIDLRAVGGALSGRLTAADLATAGVRSTLAGGADLAIAVTMDRAGDFVPALSAIFDVDWNFNSATINPDNVNTNFGALPVVTFRDVTMDLGGFMENFVAPLITQLDELLEPLQPIVDVLNANIRVLANFPKFGKDFDLDHDGRVTLVELIDKITDIDTAPIQALIDLIADVSEWVDILTGLGFADGNLRLDDVIIEGNIRDGAFALQDAVRRFDDIGDNLVTVISGLGGAGWNSGGRDILDSLTTSDIFELPVLTSNTQWFNLLMGGDADLVEVDLPEIRLGTGGERTILGPIPLFLGIKLEVKGEVDLTINMDFGFNSRGLTDPDLDPIDGFYIVDGPDAEVRLYSSVGVYVTMKAGVVGLTGGGEVAGEILMDLIDGDHDGRLYYDEFAGLLARNPFSIFEGTGRITLGFSAALDTIFGEVWRWESPTITLSSFSFGGGDEVDYNLSAPDGNRVNLNVGTRAANRSNIPSLDQRDIGEAVEIFRSVDGTALMMTLEADWSQNSTPDVLSEEITGSVLTVAANLGLGDDSLVMDALLAVYADVSGGSGNDLISGARLADTLYGNQDNDVLFGFGGADKLYGGFGNDFLNGGAGGDTLNGGDGIDRVSYIDSTGRVDIDLGRERQLLFHAANDLLTGIENIDGSNFNDTITGSQADGSLFGMEGDDSLTSGSHDQLLAGNDGNDTLVANDAGDTLVGGNGNDLYRVVAQGVLVRENLLDEVEGTGGGQDTVEAFFDISLAGEDLIETIVLLGFGTAATGNGANNRIDGNPLFGSTLAGGFGEDSLSGGGSGDVMYGGSQDDTLQGNGGYDLLVGELGNDNLFGGEGDDTLIGDGGTDFLGGGTGSDFYIADSDDAVIDLGGTDPDFVWALDDVTLLGGQSIEILSVSGLMGKDWQGAWNSIDRALGFSLLVAAEGSLAANPDLTLTGNDGAQVLIGAGGGVNVLEGRGGADTLVGDGDNDTASYAASAAAVAINLGQASQSGGDAQGDILYRITGVIGSAHDDTILGAAGSAFRPVQGETLSGEAGHDRIEGFGGNDALDGGEGNDTLLGGIGSDTLTGGRGRDDLQGGDAADTLYGGSGDDTLDGGKALDRMEGGQGNDTYIVNATGDIVFEYAGGGTDTVLSTATYTLSAAVENLTLTGFASIDARGNGLNNVLTGNSGANRLVGNGGSDTMIGGLGDDLYVTNGGDSIVETAFGGTDTVESTATHTLSAHVENLILTGDLTINGTGNGLDNVLVGNIARNRLDGGAGDDTLWGGQGDDIYVVDAGDIILERAGEGRDRVESAVSWTLGDHLEDLKLTGTAAINGTGNALDNLIRGNAASNVLRGGAGADTLNGGGGNDWLYVDSRFDVVVEAVGGGTDTVLAGVGYTLGDGVAVEHLRTQTPSGTAAINLKGNGLAQSVTGNDGANRIDGAGGKDTLTGGGGADTFVFSAAPGAGNADTIADFTTGTDRIELDSAVFALTPGPLFAFAFSAGVTGTATTGLQRILYQTGTGDLWYDADGNGAAARQLIARISGAPTLTEADFLIA